MKKLYPILVGVITMLLFGLIVGQSILAICILLNWSVSRFLSSQPILLCIFAGLVQGVCEEGGRLIAYKTVLKKYTNSNTCLLYGLGHGGIEFIYTVVTIFCSNMILSQIGINLIVRLIMLGGQIGLSIFVFASLRKKNMKYLFPVAILIHALMDAFSIAVSKNYILMKSSEQNIIYILCSVVIMGISYLIYRKLDQASEH